MSGPLRTVLAVLLAMALLTVGLGAADRAHESRTATRLDETATSLASVADRLAARNDPTPTGAARRVVSVHVPPDGSLGIERGIVRWRVGGGTWHRRQSGLLATGSARLVFGPGRHRLQLSLQRQDGAAVVVVSRAPRS